MIYYPLDFSSEQMRDRNNHFLRVYARVKPGLTIEQAQKDMDRVSAELQQEVERQNQGHASYVIGLREQMVGTCSAFTCCSGSRSRFRSPDRVRERRKSPAGAGRITAAGVGQTPGHRGQPAPGA